MKLFLEVFAVLSAILLATTVATFSLPVELDDEGTCQKNEPCRWAVCTWSQWFPVSPQHCQFVESTCRCPALRPTCTRTNAIRPGSEVIVFQYRCQ